MLEKKKKILYIVTQSEWGGAQKYVFDLATNLTEDFDITVAVGSSGHSQNLLQKLQEQNIKTVVFKHLKRDISPCHDFLAVWEIRNFLRKNDFEVVHLNSSKAGVIGALAGSFNKKIKIIYTAHGWVFEEPLLFCKRWFYLLMEQLSARLRDTTIVLSEKEKDIALKNRTAQKDKVFVIPNAVDLKKLFFLDKKTAQNKIIGYAGHAVPDNSFMIGTIANLYPSKGLEILVEAFKESLSTNSNLQLVIIGEGPEKEKLKTKIKTLNLENNVVLTGSLPNASQFLKAFNIFILSSLKEGFPYAILEAMAAELPIIVTSVGAIQEILKNEESALIIKPNSISNLSSAIGRLIQNPELSQKLSQGALHAVNKFNLEDSVKKISSLY